MGAASDRFTTHMPEVAKLLLGAPNATLSSKSELRFGSHGSVSVDLEKGAVFDHSAGEGGGLLWLIKRETGCEGREAVNWMERQGLQVEDDHRADAAPPWHDEPRDERLAPAKPVDRSAADAMAAARRRPPTKVYDYVDEAGDLIFQACRYEWEHDGTQHKTFAQRRRPHEGDDPAKIRLGWVWSIKGERCVPYRLPELIADRDAGWPIFLVEGEKDVDTLRALDLAATCNPMGAGKWWDDLTPHFAGADVVILPDDDPQSIVAGKPAFHVDGRPKHVGQDHADLVASKLTGVAASVRVLRLHSDQKKKDASDWIAAGGTRESLLALVDSDARVWSPPIIRETRFGRISFGEICRRTIKAPDYVIDDWMVAREQSMLAGESQSGKSFLAIHAALCIAGGSPIFGRQTSPGLVIYQAGESGTGVLDLRIPAWVQHHGGGDLKLPFEILPAKVDLWSEQGNAKAFIEAIKAIAAEHAPVPLRAVFIDTLSKAMAGANENDGRDVSRVLANAETISRDTGAHVCIVHHFPKGGKTLRGHGSLKADVDTVAMVAMDEATKIRTLTFDKVKDGDRSGKIQFELMQVRLGERDDGKPITSCVVLPVGEKAKAREEAQQSAAVNANERVLLEALFKALETHGLVAPAGLDVAPHTRVVEYREVRRVFSEISPIDEVDEPNATDDDREAARRRHLAKLKTRLQRAREFMTHSTKIMRVESCPDPVTGKPTDFAWWTGRPVRGFPQTQPPKPRDPQPLPDDVLAEIEAGGVSF